MCLKISTSLFELNISNVSQGPWFPKKIVHCIAILYLWFSILGQNFSFRCLGHFLTKETEKSICICFDKSQPWDSCLSWTVCNKNTGNMAEKSYLFSLLQTQLSCADSLELTILSFYLKKYTKKDNTICYVIWIFLVSYVSRM